MPRRTRARALIDCDEVLCDFLTPAFDVLYLMTGTRRTAHDLTTWGLFPPFDTKHREAFEKHIRNAGFCSSLHPLPGAVEGLRLLQEVADVFIVTAPTHGPHWYFERVEWLKRHFDIPAKSVHQAYHKSHVNGDLLVDDKLQNIVSWAEEHPNGKPFLWGQPYNKDARNFTRVLSWAPVIDYAQHFTIL